MIRLCLLRASGRVACVGFAARSAAARVVTGQSAGAHLALTTGMLTQAAGFDDRCPTPAGSGVAQDNPKVAAIVNWFGITDVWDVVQGANTRGYGAAGTATSSRRSAIVPGPRSARSSTGSRFRHR